MIWNSLKVILVGIALLVGGTVMADEMKTKTYCIGRFLIDIPEEFKLVSHDGTLRSVSVQRLGLGNESDADRLALERLRAIKNGEVSKLGSSPYILLGTDRVGDTTIIKRVLDTSSMGVQLSEPWREDVYISSAGALFHLETAADNSDLVETHADIQALTNAIHPRDQDEIPQGPVTCLQDSFFRPPPGDELISATFVHTGDSPIVLDFSTVVRRAGEGSINFVDIKSVPGVEDRQVVIAGFEGRELRYWGDQNDLYAVVGRQVSETKSGYELTVHLSDSRKDAGSEPVTRDRAEDIWNVVIKSIKEKE
jgi:hypothetical protein